MKTSLRIALGCFVVLALLAGTSISYAPWMLAFPYRAAFGSTVVYSEQPILPQLRSELARADELLAQSPLWAGSVRRTIYLTDGGWRWTALGARRSFAFRRLFSDAIVVNRSDIEHDRVANGRTIGGVRTLSGVIAHETTHILVARRLGDLRAAMLPVWKREGYADYVAQESSLSDADAARLHEVAPNSRALAYYEYRKRVATFLEQDGGTVDLLLR